MQLWCHQHVLRNEVLRTSSEIVATLVAALETVAHALGARLRRIAAIGSAIGKRSAQEPRCKDRATIDRRKWRAGIAMRLRQLLPNEGGKGGVQRKENEDCDCADGAEGRCLHLTAI